MQPVCLFLLFLITEGFIDIPLYTRTSSDRLPYRNIQQHVWLSWFLELRLFRKRCPLLKALARIPTGQVSDIVVDRVVASSEK